MWADMADRNKTYVCFPHGFNESRQTAPHHNQTFGTASYDLKNGQATYDRFKVAEDRMHERFTRLINFANELG